MAVFHPWLSYHPILWYLVDAQELAKGNTSPLLNFLTWESLLHFPMRDLIHRIHTDLLLSISTLTRVCAQSTLGALDSRTKYNLYKAYCYNRYDCELCSVDNAKIDTFGVSVRNGLCRVWGLPNVTHKALLHKISDMLLQSDEIYRQISDFIHSYYITAYLLLGSLNFILRHASLFAQASSPTGSNGILICLRYGLKL